MKTVGIARFQRHGFTVLLLLMLLLAAFFPEPGMKGGLLRPEWTTMLGVWWIFFLQGLSLPLRDLSNGYRPVRLLVFVLSWNFIFFPVLILLGSLAMSQWVPQNILLGFALLSIMPTTISSAVALTGLSGGQTACAICATGLSNLLAILIVPAWVALYLDTIESIQLPVGPLLVQLSLLIVLPLLLGQVARVCLATLAARLASGSRQVCSGVILFVIYAAFADAVAGGYFESFSFARIALLFVATGSLVLLVAVLTWLSSGLLKLTPGERLAAFFCASQKSLATGLPLAAAIFTALPAALVVQLGWLLLPLIVFHPLQLITAAIWVERVRIN